MVPREKRWVTPTRVAGIVGWLATLTGSASALAEDDSSSTATAPTAGGNANRAAKADLPAEAPQNEPAAPKDPIRTETLIPKPVEPPPPGRPTFVVDPLIDGGIVVSSSAFAGLLELIGGTGELRPQQISPDFKSSNFIWMDRVTLVQNVDPNARSLSNIGLFVAGTFAVVDPVLSAFREKSVQTGIVDAMIYAEAISVTWGITNLAKIAVRRPRPQAYIDAEAHKNDPNYSNADTDSSLSFFSGHASISATITSTATYLAFARSPHTVRPWLTLGIGTAVTTFVSIERVRAGAHFPSDVIAGAVAGAGIGVIVAHLHRSEDVKQRNIWIGYGPERSGGSVQLGGVF